MFTIKSTYWSRVCPVGCCPSMSVSMAGPCMDVSISMAVAFTSTHRISDCSIARCSQPPITRMSVPGGGSSKWLSSSRKSTLLNLSTDIRREMSTKNSASSCRISASCSRNGRSSGPASTNGIHGAGPCGTSAAIISSFLLRKRLNRAGDETPSCSAMTSVETDGPCCRKQPRAVCRICSSEMDRGRAMACFH